MIIRNEKLESHEIRVQILQACKVSKTMPELMRMFNKSKAFISNHLHQLTHHELLVSQKPSSKEPTKYCAMANDYDWIPPNPTLYEQFKRELHPGVTSYGAGGIYLISQRPASLEKHPLRKMQKNAVSGSTLGGAYFDY